MVIAVAVRKDYFGVDLRTAGGFSRRGKAAEPLSGSRISPCMTATGWEAERRLFAAQKRLELPVMAGQPHLPAYAKTQRS
jgi:hypothetical protein